MERRKTARRDCRFPLRIVQVGQDTLERSEQTRNFGSNGGVGGVCFWSADPLEVGKSIEYEITLSTMQPPVIIRCIGRVVRCNPVVNSGGNTLEIALTMTRYRFVASANTILARPKAVGRAA